MRLAQKCSASGEPTKVDMFLATIRFGPASGGHQEWTSREPASELLQWRE